MTYVETRDTKRGRRSYAFRLSRDYPKIWEDRFDIIIIASIISCLLSWALAVYFKQIAPFNTNVEATLRTRELTTYFWVAGGVICFIAVAFWFSLKNQCIRITHAPLLSRTPKFIRFTVYILLICGPYAFFYAQLGHFIDNLPDYSYYNYHGLFFNDFDPWLTWVTLAIMMAILVLIATTQVYGFSVAIGAFIAGLVQYAAIMTGATIAFGSNGGNAELAMSLSIAAGSIIVLGLFAPGQAMWVRVAFRLPALYAMTFGVWIMPVYLWEIFETPEYTFLPSVLALYGVVFLNGVLLAIAQRRLLQ